MAKLVQLGDQYFNYIRSKAPSAMRNIAPNKSTGNHTRPYLPLFTLADLDIDIDFKGVNPEDIIYHAPLGHISKKRGVHPETEREVRTIQEEKLGTISFRSMLPLKINSGLITWYGDYLKHSERAIAFREDIARMEEFLAENMEEYIEAAKKLRLKYESGRMSDAQKQVFVPFEVLEELAIDFNQRQSRKSKKTINQNRKDGGYRDSFDKRPKEGRKQSRDRSDKYGDSIWYEEMMDEATEIKDWEVSNG
ncbi:MAG: hypothetical protein FWE31_04855 [Firmicutes bacterium]|nr:hypothetical protein [Bacillota bacterium]